PLPPPLPPLFPSNDALPIFPGLGHAHGRSLGGEETDFCIRLAEARPGQWIIYEPRALVHHHVPPERASLSYFLSRCYTEGLSKGDRKSTRLNSSHVATSYAV